MEIIITLIALLYVLGKSIQLHAFSTFMVSEVHKLYKGRGWENKDIDIEKSYRNMIISVPWNFEFEKMVNYVNL